MISSSSRYHDFPLQILLPSRYIAAFTFTFALATSACLSYIYWSSTAQGISQTNTSPFIALALHSDSRYFTSRLKEALDTFISPSSWPEKGALFYYDSDNTVLESPHPQFDFIQVNNSRYQGAIPETPHTMRERVLQGFKYLYEKHPTASWYFKSDDDTYVSYSNLKMFLETFQDPFQNEYYIGQCHPWHHSVISQLHSGYCGVSLDCSKIPWTSRPSFAMGGSGYALSNAAMRRLIHKEETGQVVRFSNEDIMMSVNLAVDGLYCTNAPNFNDRKMAFRKISEISRNSVFLSSVMQLFHTTTPITIHSTYSPGIYYTMQHAARASTS